MGKKILVAEDDPQIGRMLQLMLQNTGYKVELQVDGHVVLEMQGPDIPDLLLMDIRLSGTDGLKICRHLKAMPATHHLPIILLSANTEMYHQAKDAGANHFLAKPFEMEDLLAVVTHYLGNE